MSYGIRIGAAFVGLATVGLVAVACGGKGNGSGSTPATAQSASVQAYLQCLQQHGVNIAVPSGRPSGVRPTTSRSPGVRPSRSPGGGGGGGGGGFGGGAGGLFGSTAPSGVSEQTWQAAQAACAAVRPSIGPGRNGGGNNSAITAYRNCLQDHGLTASAGGLNNLNTADPKVAAAITACAPLRPSQLPGRGPSPNG